MLGDVLAILTAKDSTHKRPMPCHCSIFVKLEDVHNLASMGTGRMFFSQRLARRIKKLDTDRVGLAEGIQRVRRRPVATRLDAVCITQHKCRCCALP